MPYQRAVILEACLFLGKEIKYHGDFEEMVLRWELDDIARATGFAIRERCRNLFYFLQDNPETSYDGRLISDLVVEQAAKYYSPYNSTAAAFRRALDRAGFIIQDDQIRRTLPESIDLPAADDEVHKLLDEHKLTTPKGHLEQAISAHSRGDWAAANSQIRSFLESLLDEIAYALVPEPPRGQNEGEGRREALANLPKPFLSQELNEWGNQGKNLLNGVFKRLHPQGSHPGLSDEEDSTFRLHLVLLLGRLFLRRFDAREH